MQEAEADFDEAGSKVVQEGYLDTEEAAAELVLGDASPARFHETYRSGYLQTIRESAGYAGDSYTTALVLTLRAPEIATALLDAWARDRRATPVAGIPSASKAMGASASTNPFAEEPTGFEVALVVGNRFATVGASWSDERTVVAIGERLADQLIGSDAQPAEATGTLTG